MAGVLRECGCYGTPVIRHCNFCREREAVGREAVQRLKIDHELFFNHKFECICEIAAILIRARELGMLEEPK